MKKLLTLLLIPFSCLAQSNWYISDNATAGKGTKADPWPISYLAGNIDHSGDTIVLLDGNYPGHFTWNVHGSKDNPVVIKSQTWMGADITGNNDRGKILQIYGEYCYMMGFEVYDRPLNGNRILNNGEDFHFSDGIHLYGQGSKIINCVVHDVMIGISMWSPSIGGELYGNLVYNIGWNNLLSARTHKGHGHAFYTQNKDATGIYKYITNNIAWGTAAEGMHVYAQSGNIEYFNISDNLMFNLIGYNQLNQLGRTFVLGGFVSANYLLFNNNMIEGYIDIGYNLGPYLPEELQLDRPYPDSLDRFKGEAIHVKFDNNYIYGQANIKFIRDFDSFSNNIFYSGSTSMIIASGRPITSVWTYPLKDNLFYSTSSQLFRIGYQSSTFSGTQYYPREQWGFQNHGSKYSFTAPPSSFKININKYDPDRAEITILNFDSLDYYTINLNGFVNKGDTIEIRDVQNIEKVLDQIIYNGIAYSFPMALSDYSPLYGNLPKDHARHTDKTINAFYIFKNSGSEMDGGSTGDTTDDTDDDPVVVIGDHVTKQYFDSVLNIVYEKLVREFKVTRDSITNHKIIIEQ